jgi:hypothetical protein
MGSYKQAGTLAQHTVNTSTDPPTKIRSGANSRFGYRVYNAGPGNALIFETPSGAAAPTLAAMLTDEKVDANIAPGETWESGGRDVDVYACAESQTAKLAVRDLEGG